MPEDTRPLREEDVDRDPFAQFDRWFAAAAAAVRMPEAMALATADADGRPSARMVLLKGHGPDGFVFHTNYASRKGAELAVNGSAALLFHWDQLGRQIRIEGEVAEISPAESDRYFATRPRGAQVAALASAQSSTVADRAALDAAVHAVEARFAGVEIPRPDRWGGYRLRPETFEFWQNREDRLHDRLRYRLDGRSWVLERLQP